MPNWKFPCVKCKNCVRTNQKSVCCDLCNNWVHFKCTNLSVEQFEQLSRDIQLPYHCDNCNPNPTNSRSSSSNHLSLLEDCPCDTPENDLDSPDRYPLSHPTLNDSTSSSDISFSSPNLSLISENDFDLVSCSDSDDSCNLGLRNLDFPSLPKRRKKTYINFRSFKYPCLICSRPCLSNRQNSLCCTICDQWVHLNCTNLTLQQFQSLTDSEKPFYCDKCFL